MEPQISTFRQQIQYRLWAILCLLLALALSSPHGWAQATQGAIAGVVKDTTGAVVTGATVKLTNTDEGTFRTIKTNEVGNYRFVDAKAGRYSLEVSAPNFLNWTATDVVLSVRQSLRLDVTLDIGRVQQDVHVNGDSVS